jgi:hypothetical protein
VRTFKPKPFAEQATPNDHPKQILAELDKIFADGWVGNEQRIADLMGALRHDGRLVRDWVQNAITQEALPELQGAQSFVIHRSQHMVARFNLWFPPGQHGYIVPEYRRYLSIDELHNHNFNFFTILLLGSGYSAQYYRDENWISDLSEGDSLPLGEPKNFQLTEDAVHLIDSLYDYHSVAWPENFSVSLNVVPNDKPTEDQYIVDHEKMVVKFVIPGLQSNEVA